MKKVLSVLRTKGIVPPSTKHGTKNLAPLPLHRYLSKLWGWGGGGAGGGRIQGPGPADPPWLAQGLSIRLFACGGAYWPLATAHSDPLGA